MARSIDNHPPYCPCAVCQTPRTNEQRNKTLGIALTPTEHAAVMAAGGSSWARARLLEILEAKCV